MSRERKEEKKKRENDKILTFVILAIVESILTQYSGNSYEKIILTLLRNCHDLKIMISPIRLRTYCQ
jgi:hypothetical protein